MIDEFDQNVHFVEIDIEEDPEVAEAAGIMGTPCVQFFKNKEMLRLVISLSLKLLLFQKTKGRVTEQNTLNLGIITIFVFFFLPS